jgi:hypothetical protein
MAGNGHPRALFSPGDRRWSVCAQDGRLVFRHGTSTIEVAVDGPLRWLRDGIELSFEEALATVPEELHGWMALAALIGLRNSLAGLATAAALPAGYHEWPPMARRAEPLAAWMKGLARLDAVDMPEVPAGIDDGLSDLGAGRAP